MEETNLQKFNLKKLLSTEKIIFKKGLYVFVNMYIENMRVMLKIKCLIVCHFIEKRKSKLKMN